MSTPSGTRLPSSGRGTKARVAPITDTDLVAVGAFLHTHLNPRVPVGAWVRALQVPWDTSQPNHGFWLAVDGAVVGAYLAYYSEREVDGRLLRICNLGAWCVLDSHRHEGLRLLMRVLGQKGYEFTDLSPSGSVVAIDRRLRFTEIDTTTVLVPGVAAPRPGIRVSGRADVLEETLEGAERRLYDDHRRAAAAIHLVLRGGDEHCYVIARKDTRKGVRAFATVLHVGNPAMFRRYAGQVAAHLAVHHLAAATLVELRVAGGRPACSVPVRISRPKMVRSDVLGPDQVDYLYSELTCLPW